MVGLSRIVAALCYAALGFGVFPCQPGSKLPATKRGFKDSSTNPDVIRAAFHSGHNIGLIGPENVLILDFDVPKDPTRSEADLRDATSLLLAQLEDSYPEVAQAPLHKTPSYGFHVFLRLPEDAEGLPTGKWPRGAANPHGDLRGMNRAYVVAPPSETSDGAYSALRPLVPVDALPKASGALLEYLNPPLPQRRRQERPGAARRARGLAALVADVRSAPEGSRNVTLNRNAFIAGVQVANGNVDASMAEHQLLVAAIDAGLTQREARATIRSGLTAGETKGRDV